MKIKKLIMKKRKKGFILSFDVLMAIIFAMTAISFSIIYFYQAEEKIHYIYSLKTADDAFAVLDYNGDLASLNENQIMSQFGILMPGHRAKVEITTIDIDLTPGTEVDYTFGEDPPAGQEFIVSGKRFFILKNSGVGITDFGVAKYLVWKE
jgi:hypothetical protein